MGKGEHGNQGVGRKGANRVNRGGSWFDSPAYVRSAFRGRTSPSSRYGRLGFRLLRSTPDPTALTPFISSQVEAGGTAQSARQLIDRDPPPPVPDWLKQSGREPVVEYKARMDRWGNIIGISVHHASGYTELDQQMMDHIKANWHYEPGAGDEWRIIKVTYDLRPQ